MRGAAGHADAAAGSRGSVLRLSKIKENKKNDALYPVAVSFSA